MSVRPLCVALLLGSVRLSAQEVAAATATVPSRPTLHAQDSLLLELAPGGKICCYAAGRGHTVWFVADHDQWTAWLDGKPFGERYDHISFPTFDSTTGKLAYIVERRNEWTLLVDGVRRSFPYSALTAPAFMDSTGRVAIGACNRTGCRLAIDSVEFGSTFGRVTPPSVAPGYKHLTYFGLDTNGWRRVQDGELAGPPRQFAEHGHWSPDGNHFAFLAKIADGDWRWVVDTAPGPSFEHVGWLSFSRGGDHYAYGGSTQDVGILHADVETALVVDGSAWHPRPDGPFSGRVADGYKLAADAGFILMTPKQNGLSDPQFLRDGRLLYAAQWRKKLATVYVDSTPSPPFEDLASCIKITPDGDHYVYVARNGDSLILVRDTLRVKVMVVPHYFTYAGCPHTSRDGTHSALQVIRGDRDYSIGRTQRALRNIVIDGEPGDGYDATGVPFLWISDDGRHFAYLFSGVEGIRFRMTVDGHYGPVYDEVLLESIHASEDGTVDFIARSGQRVLRVTMRVN